MSTAPARYALLAGLLITAVIAGLDAASPRAAVPDAIRSAGAAVTGPALTAITGAFPTPPDREAEVTELSVRLALAEAELRAAESGSVVAAADHIVDAPGVEHSVVLAQVLAVGAIGSSGPERLTIDVGTRDGIALDQSVVAADGLVGRTVRVGASTSDVLIIGAPDLVVGARGEQSGILGTVSPAGAGDPGPRQPGQLSLTTIALGDLVPGEQLVTVGSPGNQPFVAGLPIGTVTSIDPARGRVVSTAAVTPDVDVARLDVVAVIVPERATDAD